MSDGTSPDPVWTPGPTSGEPPRIEEFRSWLARNHDVTCGDYRALHAWSVEHPERFWECLREYFDVPASGRYDRVLHDRGMPDVEWFPGLQVNYVDQVLRHADLDTPALIDESEPGGAAARTWSWSELLGQAGTLAARLREAGVEPGDRVVGYLPNIGEAVVAFLATASLGAVWSSCGQDYSAPAATERLGQLDPKVLIAADGYRYGGKESDRRMAVASLREWLPTVQATIVVSRLGLDLDGFRAITGWDEATAGAHPLEPVAVPFGHPLWVLFSSGTTGRPKGIVHGHGGVVLEHLKQMAFHLNLRPGDRYFWYTSPSWMMWNFQVAGLLVGATIVTFDGSPGHPGPDQLWELAARHRVRVLGTSPAYLQACKKAGMHPGESRDLSALEVLGATGSVLPDEVCAWAVRELDGRTAVASTTGGTDVVSAFAGFVPTEPVRPGELSVPCLGVALEAWDPRGRPVVDEVGELVVTAPIPSMPLRFWDDDGSRYRSAYFDMWPGVWRHGDWITVTRRGSVVVHGRSDSTLNRNGVRMGSSDIYQVVEKLPEITEALVLGVEYPDGGYWMPLFVVLAKEAVLDDDLRGRIRSAIRDGASPRHVPDDIIAVGGIPHTRTGKKLEVPLKRLMQGAERDAVVDPQSVDDASLLDAFTSLAAGRRAETADREDMARG